MTYSYLSLNDLTAYILLFFFFRARLEHVKRPNMHSGWSCGVSIYYPNSPLRLGLATFTRGYTPLISEVDDRLFQHLHTQNNGQNHISTLHNEQENY